ncbi:hypothetical protein H0H87_011986 [Tephrocybe sp. NHM501043]|nr:hypothetical protein H0H87_011986 [Tephrocybe sp. NHM501043]
MNDPHFSNQIHYEIDEYPMSSIEQLERTFCTNFSCCNILLPDLHALLDHYDVTASGQHSIPRTPIPALTHSASPSPPSSPGSSSSPNSSPHRRYVTLWPVASPTCAVNATEIAVSAPFVYQPDAYALSEYPTYEHCYDAATSPQVRRLEQTVASNIPTSGLPRDHESEIGDKGQRKRSSSSAPPGKTPVKRKGKVDHTGAPLVMTRKRNKKAYQCPTPGCTKSYLNPNGLKYHQEKGTCKIEERQDSLSSLFNNTDAIPIESPLDVPAKPSTIVPDHPPQLPRPTDPPIEHQQIHHPQPRQAPDSTMTNLNPIGPKHYQEKRTCNLSALFGNDLDMLPAFNSPPFDNISADASPGSDHDRPHQPPTHAGSPIEHQYTYIHHPQPRQSLYNVVQWRAEQGINVGGGDAATL